MKETKASWCPGSAPESDPFNQGSPFTRRTRIIFWRNNCECPSRYGSVGWLVYDGDTCKVLIPHITGNQPNNAPKGCGDMAILAQSIILMTVLHTA